MSKTNFNSFTEQHKLGFKLRPILVGELYLVGKLSLPAYVFKDEAFVPMIPQGTVPSRDQIHQLIKESYKEVFISFEDFEEVKSNLQNALIKVTRSLSVGDPLENGIRDIKLMSLNLGGLYQDPHSDQMLMLQFQSSQNLSKFLIENKRLQSYFFSELSREKFHFTLTQPMLSSLLLLSFLQSIHLFHEKEIESLFLTSYLKDLGFSLIPNNKYDTKNLTQKDQELFSQHADFSFDLLEGRVPLSKNYLNIIRHHHFLNDKLKDLASKTSNKKSRENDLVMGIESTLVAVFDILVAMISERPYRKSLSLYQALEVIKRIMADDYPQEFKAIVVFLKQFFKN